MKEVCLTLILFDNKIVFFKRSSKNKYFKGMYGLIGGLKGHHETGLECIKRELLEETALEAENIIFLKSYNYYDKLLNVYFVEIPDLSLITLNQEHVDFRLFSESDLKNELVIDTTMSFYEDFKNVSR